MDMVNLPEIGFVCTYVVMLVVIELVYIVELSLDIDICC